MAAGSLIAYPSTTLVAAVGWARSFIRDASQREILFDLDRARRTLFSPEGKTPKFDLISKSVANLTRMWAQD